MGAVRTPTLRARPAQLAAATLTTPTDAGTSVRGLLSDLVTTVHSKQLTLGVSNDHGANITWGKVFTLASGTLGGFIETPGGEVLVSLNPLSYTNAGAVGEVWRSTGWNKTTADATSWTKVRTAPGPGVAARGFWGFNQFGVAPSWSARAGEIFIAEYGTRTNATTGADITKAATKVLRSTDDGVTWTVIFDLADRYSTPLTKSLHVHGCCYDPWDDRVYVTQGDGGFADGGACGLWYANGEAIAAGSPTWTLVPGSQSINATQQSTTVVPMEKCLVLLPDGAPPAIRRIPRRGYRNLGPITQAAPLGTSGGFIGAHAWRNPDQPGAPLLLSSWVPADGGDAPPAIYATQDGERFETIWQDTALASQANGINHIVGPTLSGKIVASYNPAGTVKQLVGEYVPVAAALAKDAPRAGGGWIPRANKLLVSSMDPLSASTVQAALTSGTLYGARGVMGEEGPLTQQALRVSALGAGISLAKVAAFSALSGEQLAVADLASFLTTGAFTSAGIKTAAYATPSRTLPAGFDVILALLVVFTTTSPTFSGGPTSGFANWDLASPGLQRFGTYGTALADMPTAITPTAGVASAFWPCFTAA